MTDQGSRLVLKLFEGNAAHWNQLVTGLSGAHILQSWEWGAVKGDFGWQPFRLVWTDSAGQTRAAAQVLVRSVRPGRIGPALKIAYVPRGPLLDWNDPDLRGQVLTGLEGFARSKRTIFIKIDPEVKTGFGVPGSPNDTVFPSSNKVLADLAQRGWIFSPEQIQFRNTVLLDLDGNEEDWLARMKQKARYNIRLACRKEVIVRQGSLDDAPLLYQMYAETSLRDGFVIRSEEYYRRVWAEFFKAGMAVFLIAEVEHTPTAALILFAFNQRAWYLYGMSRDVHREKMPNHLLQWEAMRLAKARGCGVYDLWGAPDVFEPGDSMWGVYRFKEGLGGKVIRTAGAFDFPVHKSMYRLYTQILPKILNIMRKRGVDQTRREVTL